MALRGFLISGGKKGADVLLTIIEKSPIIPTITAVDDSSSTAFFSGMSGNQKNKHISCYPKIVCNAFFQTFPINTITLYHLTRLQVSIILRRKKDPLCFILNNLGTVII